MGKLYFGNTLISGGGGGDGLGVGLSITGSQSEADEGDSVAFTITTTPATASLPISWQITGVSALDVTGGQLSGIAITNGSGVATVTVEIREDMTTEGTETLTFLAIPAFATFDVTIADTSVAAIARHWRMFEVQVRDPSGGYFELCEISLHDSGGARITTPTPTCSTAPNGGTLASLNDGLFDAFSRPYWNLPGNVQPSGFWFAWDLGSGNDAVVKSIRFANSQISAQRGLKGFIMQWSNDGSSWNNLLTLADLPNPGQSVQSDLTNVQ
jgi:hypothetical protein